MNNLTLIGRTTSAIELKQTTAGKSVATFTLAVKRPFTKDTTDFFNCTIWDKQAETISKHVSKGEQIGIVGYLQNRTWNDKEGNKRTATEIVVEKFDFCSSKNDAQGTNTSAPSTYMPDAYKVPQSEKFEAVEDISDSDLPF